MLSRETSANMAIGAEGTLIISGRTVMAGELAREGNWLTEAKRGEPLSTPRSPTVLLALLTASV
jgi:hypothetical protein